MCAGKMKLAVVLLLALEMVTASCTRNVSKTVDQDKASSAPTAPEDKSDPTANANAARDDLNIFKPVDVALNGQYSWQLIYFVNNTGQNNPYKETRTITTVVRTSYMELTRHAVDASVSISTNIEVGGVIEVISAKVSSSIDATLSYSYQTTVEQRSETEVTREIVREFNVGADSVGEMYRLIYRGPGVTYETDVVASDSKRQFPEVIIDCKVKQVALLSNIKVVYTDQDIDMPSDAITETKGETPDVNSGYGGKYIWLVPEWVRKADDAATGIRFVVQDQENTNYADLAKDSGGQYRYLKMLHDPRSYDRIQKVGLLRSPKSYYIFGDKHKYGWDECTRDINENRSGDYLHLCWNVVST